jgi:hypothetical protein
MNVLESRPPVTGVTPATVRRSPLADSRHLGSEWNVAAAVIIAFVLMELLGTGAGIAITRPLWLDEIHTLLLAGYGDLSSSMRSLAAGSDFNPPTLFLIYRFVGAVSGGLSEVSMRVVALASVVATLALVYRLLRDDFARLPSALGTLAVWAQPIVTAVAFDARFYGPWLFGIATLLVALRRAIDRPVTAASSVFLALASAFVCTIHYFGIVSWALAVAMAIARARRPRRGLSAVLSPALVGPASLLACVPLYLGQRAALSVPTWIPAASVGDHLLLLGIILLPLATLVALTAWGATRLLSPLAGNRMHAVVGQPLGASGMLLLAQAAVPIALAIFSLVVQPATQPRYWIAGSLAAAPAVAYAVSRTASLLRSAVAVGLAALSVSAVRDEVASARTRERTVREDVAAARRAVSEGTILVARRRHTLYPLLRAMPGLKTHAMLLDSSTGTRSSSPDDKLLVVDRDVARVHARFYGFPRLASPAQLSSLTTFYFLELDTARTPDAGEVPGHVVERVGPRVFRFRPR